MTRSTRIALAAAAALLVGGTTIPMAQNGPATGGYPPTRWNLYRYGYGYYPRYYAYYPSYPTLPGYWEYYRTNGPGRGTNEESTR